ncbi:GNAT domain-containing protein [Talaromyces proteolyticus]|uniref:GNAT domain-containing protein n=1 Tax=Talaromyces proteolyticus TaxID=1131652 RepID=A0AAD4PU27_9EURO|nr:GNAT domain-containing protein [Talaromyces proteolyticus]KAH8688817.1 GNAT domain-containing protein [Talaromyces proteolyticus]
MSSIQMLFVNGFAKEPINGAYAELFAGLSPEITSLNNGGWSIDHLEGYYRIWSIKEATRWSSHGICTSLDDTRSWMAALLVENNPDAEVYAIFLKPDELATDDQDKNLIGVIGTHKTDPIPELSYIFHPSAWGKGYATEALKEYSGNYFTLKSKFDQLTAWVDTENLPSIKVLRKCGFVEEKTEKGDYVIPWMEPQKRDSILFVMKNE